MTVQNVRTQTVSGTPVLTPARRKARPPKRDLLLPRERSLKPILAAFSMAAFGAGAYISVHAYSTGESYELRRLNRAMKAEQDRHEDLIKQRERLLNPKTLADSARKQKLELLGPPDDDLELSR